MVRKHKAWSRQKDLIKSFDEVLPDLADLKEKIEGINIGTINMRWQTLRVRALFAIYYLTACRVSEVLKFKEAEPLRKKDIKIKEIEGRDSLMIKLGNRKNKARTIKRQPIPIDKEKEIVGFIENYLIELDEEDILFPFTRGWAIKLINKATGWNVHFIRHIRATHLITKYDFNEQMLIKFMGWTDSRPAKHYMELKSRDLFKEFYKGDK